MFLLAQRLAQASGFSGGLAADDDLGFFRLNTDRVEAGNLAVEAEGIVGSGDAHPRGHRGFGAADFEKRNAERVDEVRCPDNRLPAGVLVVLGEEVPVGETFGPRIACTGNAVGVERGAVGLGLAERTVGELDLEAVGDLLELIQGVDTQAEAAEAIAVTDLLIPPGLGMLGIAGDIDVDEAADLEIRGASEGEDAIRVAAGEEARVLETQARLRAQAMRCFVDIRCGDGDVVDVNHGDSLQGRDGRHCGCVDCKRYVRFIQMFAVVSMVAAARCARVRKEFESIALPGLSELCART